MATRAALATLALAMLFPRAALATIISDGGFRCIFSATGAAATVAQRNISSVGLAAEYDRLNLGCALHPVPSSGGTFPFAAGLLWCERSLAPRSEARRGRGGPRSSSGRHRSSAAWSSLLTAFLPLNPFITPL
jgi:hypothetical protein